MRLVKGLSGVLLVQAATLSAGPLDGAWFKGTTDKCPIDYQVGEAMTFTNVNAGSKVFSTGSVALSEAGTYTISVSSVADIYRCSFAAI